MVTPKNNKPSLLKKAYIPARREAPVWYWMRFYPTAQWEPAKFWVERANYYIMGFDWLTPASQKDFGHAEVGPRINHPERG